ncbi:MAG: mechanosensitive ion channel [Acidobacteria bacterium]|nr:mechanosensitive ion channel [Acidobacteriota bacterium]
MQVSFLAGLLCTAVLAQAESKSGSEASGSATPTPTPTATPTPIPVSSVLSEAEAATAKLKTIRTSLDNSSANAAIDGELEGLRHEIDRLEVETGRILSGNPSLDELRSAEQNWLPVTQRLTAWTSDLQRQALEREKDLADLARMADTWNKTLSALTGSEAPANTEAPTVSVDSVPEEVLQKVRDTIADIKATTSLTEGSQRQVLSLQTRVTGIDAQIASILSEAASRRNNLLSGIFRRDGPPAWSVLNASDLNRNSKDAGESVTEQIAELRTYAASRFDRFLVHGLLFFVIVGALYWARSFIRPHVEAEPKLETAAQVFALPVVSALVISIFLSGWLYPQAPVLLRALIGLAGLVPAVILMRRLVGRSYHLLLNAMVFFFFLDRIRDVFPDHSSAGRFLFLGEMAAAVIFLFWVYRSKSFTKSVEARESRTIETLKKTIPFLAGIFGFAFLAQLFGYVNLANLVGNGVLSSIYAALIIYATLRIIQGVVIFALRMRPLSLIKVVKNNRYVIRETIFKFIRWIAALVWVLVVLNVFSVYQYVFEKLSAFVSLSFGVGGFEISIGDIIVFAATLWVAVLISRFLQFILKEELYPRWAVGRGASYAISTTLHYAVIVIGFLFAVGELGVDFTKFAIVAGAIGVGIGFGLQTIINNFVSGLILLFERPVKVGDTIQIDEHVGSLKEIGLRASVLRKVDGSDVIVPNSMLVSEQVVNWTMSDTKRRIDIMIGVAYGTDPKRIMDILYQIASTKEDILSDPEPKVLFSNLGESSIDFELRVWVEDPEKLVGLRSEMVTDIYAALNDAGIELPFPQRDVHLRSVDDDTLRNLTRKK